MVYLDTAVDLWSALLTFAARRRGELVTGRNGAVPHGFRSIFRDWAAECTDAPREVCELALAHVNTNSIEAAYRRTDLFERRRELMERWAAFLAGTAVLSPLVELPDDVLVAQTCP